MDLEGDSGRRARDQVRVHVPVLLRETLEVLGLAPGMTVVDGTAGALGHGRVIAEALGRAGLLVGLDRDAEILARASASLAREAGGAAPRAGIRLFHRSFAEMGAVLAELGLPGCDRVLLDLGVSSLHLDSPERGFSFMHDAALDMRMDRSAPPTAAAWLARTSEAQLARVLAEYGEERYARRIARSIVQASARGRMTRTGDLVEAVLRAVPAAARRGRIHPATRTFQAIRIAVNDELGELERGLAAALACLRDGGRLAVISFHSLEDRMVKQFLRAHMEVLTKKPIASGADECRRNPRARSAKLRCGSKRPTLPRAA